MHKRLYYDDDLNYNFCCAEWLQENIQLQEENKQLREENILLKQEIKKLKERSNKDSIAILNQTTTKIR